MVVADNVVEDVAVAENILELICLELKFGWLVLILGIIFQVVLGIVEDCKWGLFLELKLWNLL